MFALNNMSVSGYRLLVHAPNYCTIVKGDTEHFHFTGSNLCGDFRSDILDEDLQCAVSAFKPLFLRGV